MTSPATPSDSASAAAAHAAPGAMQISVEKTRTRGLAGSLLEMCKPRITTLILITCIAGMLCAAEGFPPLSIFLLTSLGLAMSSAGASALNHVYDRDIDVLMGPRTASRPVVVGDVSARAGTAFGIGLLVIAGVLLWFTVGPLTAVLAEIGGLFYVLVYTMWLKRTTVQNIVIGGAAGAVPPLVGWAAVNHAESWGDLAAVTPWALFAIIFFWTPPHFWALALMVRKEYANAGVPMLPVVVGERATVKQIWWYTLALTVVTLAPVAFGAFGLLYLVVAAVLCGWFIKKVVHLRRVTAALAPGADLVDEAFPAGRLAARGVFLASMSWLAFVFLAAVIDRAVFTVHLF